MKNQSHAAPNPSALQALDPKPLLSVAQAAEFLGISSSWLNKAHSSGIGPTATVIGRRVLYDVHDLRAWLASKKRKAASTT